MDSKTLFFYIHLNRCSIISHHEARNKASVFIFTLKCSKALFRVPAQICCLAYPDWLYKVWTAKNHMKCDVCKSDASHIWRCFEMWVQSHFYRYVSVWLLWPQRDTTTTATSNPEWRRCIRVAEQSPCCYWQRDCLEGEMMDLHRDTQIRSDYSQITAWTVCLKDLMCETNLTAVWTKCLNSIWYCVAL